MKKYILLNFAMVLLLIIVILMAFHEDKKETPEEKQARIEAWEASRHHEYEIVSVSQYMKTTTNQFGAIISQEPAFYFTYVDGTGQVHSYDDYTYSEYGLHQLKIGESNKYVIEDGFDTYRYLYLTKDTLKSLNISGGK